jgi:hypothetical protein
MTTNDPNDPTTASARPGDPSTSHEAAALIAQSRLEWDVWQVLLAHRPRYLNSLQVARIMNVDKWSISPRFKPLWRKGLLKDPVKLPALNSSGNIRNLMHWSAK